MSNKNKKQDLPRRKRVPLGTHHQKMSVPEEMIPDTHVARWFNDKDNRIQRAIDAGYEFVKPMEGKKIGDGERDGNTDIGTKVSKIVGENRSGDPMRAYLMMIRKEWYEEDQAKKMERVNAIDEAIGTPGFGAAKKGLDKSKTYGKISYEP